MHVPTTVEEIQNFSGKYPRQLWYLFLVEMWERFTFYGMRALLGLYIAHLMLSTNYVPAEQATIDKKVAEFREKGETLNEQHPRWYVETSEQKLHDNAEAIANRRYGMIQAFIYAMAFVGGFFADKLFGFRISIFWGGTLMAIGTFVMAIPGSLAFYLGISILIVGNGFFKPNISTIVGTLYKADDPRRAAGFSLFYSGINIGAFLSGLTIGWIGTSYSWSLGFSLAGIFMLLGLGLFAFTQKSLGPLGLPPASAGKIAPSVMATRLALTLLMVPIFFLTVYYPVEINLTSIFGTTSSGKPFLIELSDVVVAGAAIFISIYLAAAIGRSERSEARKLIAALILIFFSVAFWSFFEQGGGSLNFFAVSNVNGHGFNMTALNNSLNALFIILLSPLMGLLWLFLNKRGAEPNTVIKFGLSFLFLGAGFLLFYASKFAANAEGITPLWYFCAAYLAISVGELCLSPIGLSIMTQLAPQRLYGVMMGTWFLASAFGQYGAGLIGAALATSSNPERNLTNLEKLEQYAQGYMMIGYIALGAGLVLVVLSPLVRKLMGNVN